MPVTDITKDIDNRTPTLPAEFAAPHEPVWALYADPPQPGGVRSARGCDPVVCATTCGGEPDAEDDRQPVPSEQVPRDG